MSRWRKVKQGKAQAPETKKEKKSQAPETLCAPVTVRLKAFLTDTFMIVMPILYVVIYLVMGDREGFREHMGEGWLIILALHFLSVIALWALKGQTPGMKAYDLYFADPKPSLLKLLIRYVTMQAGILSFFGLFVPFLLKSRATLWDLVSGSCLIYRPQ